MGVLSLNKGTKLPPRTPAREALAAIHNEVVGAARDLGKARQAAERARDLHDQTATRFHAATEAAGAAKANHTEAMLHAARTGNAVELSTSHRELRHAEIDRADEYAAARAALEQAEADRDRAEDMVRLMHDRRARAADAVFSEALPQLITEYEEALDALWVKCEPFWALWSLNVDVPKRSTLQMYVEAVRGVRISTSVAQPSEYPAKERWAAAREALLINPDAPLPTDQSA